MTQTHDESQVVTAVTSMSAARSEPTFQVGRSLSGRYKLIRPLGSGGFATVYEADDMVAGGRVAIKVLAESLSHDPDFVARFGHEVEMVRALRHPNTISVWDVGLTDDGTVYTVMELVSGRTLASAVRDEGALPTGRTLAIVDQMLRALSEAHDHGIVHRDLKPDNVMLCDLEGDPDFVKILDFGVAKALANDRSAVETHTGVAVGTPGYTAPEVLMGDPASPAADVYSVGLILTELLLGDPAVAPDSAAKMVSKQLELDTERLSGELPERWLAPIVRRALHREPAHRFKDAQDMRRALHQAATERGWDAVLPTPTGPLASVDTLDDVDDIALPVFKTRALWGLLGVGLVAVAILTLLPGPQGQPSPNLRKAAIETTTLETLDRATEAPDEPQEADLLANAYVPLGDLPGGPIDEMGWDWLDDVVPQSPTEPVEETERPRTVRHAPATEPDTPSTDDSDETVENPRELFVESAVLDQQAIDLLESALSEGVVEPERRAEASGELRALYERQIDALLQADLCDAAARRLADARSAAPFLNAPGETPLFPDIETSLAGCRERRLAAAVPWDAQRYQTLVRRGSALYDEARAVPVDDAAQRDPLLGDSLRAHRQARQMLASALADPALAADRLEGMARSQRWLDTRIIALECTRNRCAAAQLHLDEVGAPVGLAVIDDAGWQLELEDQIAECRQRASRLTGGFSWALIARLRDLSTTMRTQARELIAAQRPVFTARVRITSNPSRANIIINGRAVGYTPFEGTIEADQPEAELVVRHRGFERRRTRVDLREAELEEHVELEPDHPFGRTDSLSGRLRGRL